MGDITVFITALVSGGTALITAYLTQKAKSKVNALQSAQQEQEEEFKLHKQKFQSLYSTIDDYKKIINDQEEIIHRYEVKVEQMQNKYEAEIILLKKRISELELICQQLDKPMAKKKDK